MIGREHLRHVRSTRARLPRPLAPVVLAMTLTSACAGVFSTRAGVDLPRADDRSGWGSLVAGRDAEASASFDRALAEDAADPWALFGDASLSFERGRGARALRSYLALLERAAEAPTAVTPLLAAAAVGRVTTLLDEHPGPEPERRALEDRLLAVPLAQLPWEARAGLAVAADQIARRRGDPELLARAARRFGCVRSFDVVRPAGVLPHLDLDARVPAEPAGRRVGSRIEGVGCVVSVPSFAGQAGAQRVVADVVTSAGSYDVVLDFWGEARVLVDGAPALRHGVARRYGPRASAARLSLGRGRHRLELRLATSGGRPNVMLLVIPAGAGGDVGASAARVQAWPSPSIEDSLPGSDEANSGAGTPQAGDPLAAAVDLAATYVANRRGDSDRAWRGATRLARWARFAVGLAFTAVVERDDPSVPASFGRDRARTALRAALAVDGGLGRAWHSLATIALEEDRPREAIDEAVAAAKAAPDWWLPELTLNAAYALRGLAWDADRALDAALAKARWACPVVEAALRRAEDREDLAAEATFEGMLSVCGADADERIERLRRRGDLPGAEAALRRVVALGPDRIQSKVDLASVLMAEGRAAEAARLLAATVEDHDGDGQVRLADARIAAGDAEGARRALVAALAVRPDTPEIVRAARSLGVALPVDRFRLDGRQVIHDFEASGRKYAAPAVVVLDRTVSRLFPSGAEMILTHEIVRVQSKDAISKWGEVSIPEGTDILVLRTHKSDGTTREPEELTGKDSISAADLGIGDYVEKETIEIRPPRPAFVSLSGDRGPAHAGGGHPRGPAFTGGYLGDRFYFQSFDAPLDRSEYMLVSSPELADALHFDARAGAPTPVRTPVSVPDAPADPAANQEPLVITTFAAAQVPQLFAERSSVPAIEHVPSVRASTGVGWLAWSRFLREQLYGTDRDAPILSRAAAAIRAQARGKTAEALGAALVAWVGQNVEAEEDLRELASFSVARGRGNRLAVMLALARSLGLTAEPVLARSRLTADADAAAPLEEVDDFADPLIRFRLRPGDSSGAGAGGRPAAPEDVRYVDPRLKHAPFGYLPPGLEGARVFLLDQARFEVASSHSDDHRTVDIAVRLDGQGRGVAQTSETLRGWPALEWAEILDRFGSDRTKLRQDFEQRWLGVQFPGAVLNDLEIEVLGADGRQAESSATSHASPSPSPSSASSPGAPYAAAEVRLRYSFTSSRLALKRDREMRILPSFFRSQPGRRYATEPRRGTALLTGFDVPLDLRARVELPAGSRLIDPDRLSPGHGAGVIARNDGYRFLEERKFEARAATGPVLWLRREARLPIMRVTLQEYPAVADELRRVDALEQEEILIGVGPERPAGSR